MSGVRLRLSLLAVAVGLLLAHLLLIPYPYQPLSLDEALAALAGKGWMTLGSDQNVALVSRALMFLPLGLVLAAAFAPRPQGPQRLAAWLAALLLGTAWAAAVNFLQLWFPPRTVSLNNLVAEMVGVGLGGLAWAAAGHHLPVWTARLSSGGAGARHVLLGAYAAGWLAVALLPFDFVTSAAEFRQKLDGELYALWQIPGGCGPAPCALKFLAAVLIAMPCGWWYADRRAGADRLWRRAVPLALLVATAIELLHFFMVSGVTQGASLLARTVGLLLGVAAHGALARLPRIDLDRWGRPAVLAAALPWLLAVAYVGGWFRSGVLGWAPGLQRIDDIVWMPFYYQYLNPYTDTMRSTLVHAVLYAPVGLACWVWARRGQEPALWRAALPAAAIAFVAESAKLFLARRQPDYTDVIIAAASAAAVLALLRLLSAGQCRRDVREGQAVGAKRLRPTMAASSRSAGSGLETGAPQRVSDAWSSPPAARTAAPAQSLPGLRVLGAVSALAAVAGLADFPVWSLWLALGCLLYAVALWRQPLAYLLVLPMALPLLDLAPWSGRLLWDEFDLLLATTLAVRWIAGSPAGGRAVVLPWVRFAVLGVSLLLSMLIGLWPPGALDANALSGYLGGYNALRVGKGYLWGLGLLLLIAQDLSVGRPVRAWLLGGLVLGLAAAAAGVFMENLALRGSLLPSTAFRAAGLVSANHVGGAYLEAVLVMLIPWALALVLRPGHSAGRALAAFALCAGLLALMLTLSRAAFGALFVSLLVFVWFGGLRTHPSQGARTSRRWLAAAVVMLAGGVLLALQSGGLGQRLAQARSDLPVRVGHWQDSLSLLTAQPARLVFGMGLGSFPRTYYLEQAGQQDVAAHRHVPAADGVPARLVLLGGQGLYVDQRLAWRGSGVLRLSGSIRSSVPGAQPAVALCLKSLLTAVECRSVRLETTSNWAPFEVSLEPPEGARTLRGAPMTLSLHNARAGAQIEFAGLSLRDGGTELLRNGGFEAGLDGWFFTSDRHLAWRAHSTPVQVLLEQGLVGILASVLLFLAVLEGLRRLREEPVIAAAIAAATAGFVLVGWFDSLLDWPRLPVLLALVLGLALVRPRPLRKPGLPGRPLRAPAPPRARRPSP